MRLSSAVCMMAAASVPFRPPGADRVADPEAQWAFARMKQRALGVPGVAADTATSFYAASSDEADEQPRVLFLHGGDSTCLEWRSVLKRLGSSPDFACDCIAVDWWTGGWTARAPITEACNAGAQPWDCIRAHLRAFWEAECGGRPVHLVGTSMGGAVALDFASTHPEAVDKLVLVDSGGESYAAPPPLIGRLLAPVCPVVLRLLAWALPRFGGEAGYLASLHRNEPGWQDAYVAYLGSGGYARRVGRERIRAVPHETLVLWGANDPVLDPADAASFARDLPRCAGVRTIAGAGHAPHMDAPDEVAAALTEFF